MINLTKIILEVLGIAASAVSAFLIPWIKGKIGEQKWYKFTRGVSIAVDAAEQLGITKQVEDKYKYALSRVKIYMVEHNLTYDEETIRAAIEAHVYYLRAADNAVG